LSIVLVLPVGSADVERGFSIFDHFRISRRGRLTPKHIEDITRIRVNSPDINTFDATLYTLHWLSSGHIEADDPEVGRKKTSRSS